MQPISHVGCHLEACDAGCAIEDIPVYLGELY
jgi:hypothetical protein